MNFLIVLVCGILAQEEMVGRGITLETRIQNAQDKCGYYMEKALFCQPPEKKQGKYAFRINKVSLY